MLVLVLQYQRSEDGSRKKDEILKELTETTRHRKHLDASVELIGTVLFGPTANVLNPVRETGLPLVDDWECLKSMVKVSQFFNLISSYILLSSLFSTWMFMEYN